MLLKNIGSKIINVGATVLMPGEGMTISDTMAEIPAVRTLCDHGLLALEKDDRPEKEAPKKEAPIKEESIKTEAVETVAEEPEKVETEEVEVAQPAKRTAKRTSKSKKASE